MKSKTIIGLAAAIFVVYMDAAVAANDWVTLRPGKPQSPPNAATTNSGATASAATSSQGGSAQGVGSQGQSLAIDSHAVYEGSRAAVSTAVAPPLTSSNDTCMGSTSAGVSAMSVGLSIGSTWTDNNCLMLKNAREMWNMGFKGAAMARMCMDDKNREALEATGVNCPSGRRNAKKPAELGSSANNTEENYRY